MDSGDKLLMAGVTAAAVMVGAYVLWGPSGNYRTCYKFIANLSGPFFRIPKANETWPDRWTAQLWQDVLPEHFITGIGSCKWTD